MGDSDRTFIEVYHSTLEDDITIVSKFFLDPDEQNKAHSYAHHQLLLLPEDAQVAMRKVHVHLGETHPIMKADEHVMCLSRPSETRITDQEEHP